MTCDAPAARRERLRRSADDHHVRLFKSLSSGGTSILHGLSVEVVSFSRTSLAVSFPAMPASPSIYVCLNRGTAGGSLPFDQFVALARDAGFEGCDVDMGYAPWKGVSALRDLFEKGGRKL